MFHPSQSGGNLVLTIDKGTQEKVYEVIQSIVETYGSNAGVVIIADVHTGEIISMVSWPTFDANALSKGITNQQYQEMLDANNLSFYNRAISGEYALGSTVKPVLGLAGLEEGLIEAEESVYCEGRIALPGGGFKNDWKAHGYTDLNKAIAESCDVYFYILGGGYGNKKGLGIDRMNYYYRLFGFGQKTGIDIAGERIGLLPDPEWKKERFNTGWFVGDDYNVSIGQGYFLATPMQLTMATAAIANGGKLIKPRLVKKVLDSEGKDVISFDTEVLADLDVDQENLEKIKIAMRETVLSSNGTARGLQLMPVSSAAKTGTAQTSKAEVYHNLMTVFAPYENPEVSITVIIESTPKEMNAANIATRQIMSYYFGERLEKKVENIDLINKNMNEITSPDAFVPINGAFETVQEVVIPSRIREEIIE